MGDRDSGGKAGMVGWVLRKLVTTPATWLGIAAGVAVGMAFAGVSGLAAGIGMGSLVGIGAAVISFGVIQAARSAYSKAGAAGTDVQARHREERERTMLAKLKAAGMDEDADVLAKMLEARDAILRRCEGPDVRQEIGAPTMELVSQLIGSALHRSEELLDLTRRLQDPLLDSPQAAEETIAACRKDLVRAYQATADSRSRILLHKEPSAARLLEEPGGGSERELGSLAEQLEEETTILKGVDRRLRGLDLRDEAAESEGLDGGSTAARLESESS